MPKVVISYSDEEKTYLNADGHARGCASCPVCGDSMAWKKFHQTKYATGEVARTNNGAVVTGSKSYSVLCQDCWESLAVADRVAAYQLAARRLYDSIKSVIRGRDAEGKPMEDPDDRIRYDKESAVVGREIELILAAVQEGG